MTEGNEFHPPKIYAIWVDARPESPMAGLSGFLSENSRRLFFTERGDAELKIRDMEALRLNRHPAAEYRCVEYPGGYDAERSIQAELLKTISLQADPEIMRYEVTDRIYGNTGGGHMDCGSSSRKLTSNMTTSSYRSQLPLSSSFHT